MKGENIVCFAKDYSEVPTSNNHVMTELARHNRVLWLNSISTRRPSFGSRRDLRKIFHKLTTMGEPLRCVRENLWVHTPLVLPLPHSPWAQSFNQRLLCRTIDSLRRRLGMREFQLWTFLPNTAGYIGRLNESVAVYYCVDEWAGFSNLDAKRTADAERELCQRVDIVFTAAQSLAEKRRMFNSETHVARHGVDHPAFAGALLPETRVPNDIARLPQPVIGFYGTIADWIDQGLIARLASRHPEWSIALIGDVRVDVSTLLAHRNIHLLGRKAHAELPGCCRGFDVGIIPYQTEARMRHVNPIKLREYLSAGLPVVSTALPEVEQLSEFCHVAADHEEFEKFVERALIQDSAQQRHNRSEAMRCHTWEQRVHEVGQHVMRVKLQRCDRTSHCVPA